MRGNPGTEEADCFAVVVPGANGIADQQMNYISSDHTKPSERNHPILTRVIGPFLVAARHQGGCLLPWSGV
jgi:hypothetical protein